MARKGTAGRTPDKQIGAHESAVDKAIKKTKETFDGDNEATEYEDVKGRDEQEAAKEYSKKEAEDTRNNARRNE